MPFELCHQRLRYIYGSDTSLGFWLFDNDLPIRQYTVTADPDLAVFPVDVTPLQTQQLTTPQTQAEFHVDYKLHLATCGFTPTEQYKNALEKKLEVWLPEDAEYLGMFLCQGHMGKEQQSAMIARYPDNADELEKMFQIGETHPDDNDLRNAIHFARTIQEQLEYGS